MSSFGYKDARALECAEVSWPGAVYDMLRRHLQVALGLLLAFLIFYALNIVAGLHAAAQTGGTLGGLALDGSVTIARDHRDIPHIRAGTLHDLFFAQGFAEASDRLFQMDITRRYAYGTLAEVFGPKALPIDEDQRAPDIRGIAAREWRHLDRATRNALSAFSDGVNAAIAREPLPVEFRMLLYEPARWTPQDSLAVSAVAMLELADSWRDVESRSDRWNAITRACFDLDFPLSDPRYDVSLNGNAWNRAARHGTPAQCARNVAISSGTKTHTGSNAWAAGGARTQNSNALIANDPHVDLTIPGIWYVVDLQAPGLHAAGAVVPGLPGVTLGHNEYIAWAVTNAQVATTVLYHAASLPKRDRVVERFNVRFSRPVTKTYYRTARLYSIPDQDEDGVTLVLWPPYAQIASPVTSSLQIDAARDVHSAMRALAAYHGSPENFLVGDVSGTVAYHLAGDIPDDPAWGRYVHDGRDLRRLPAILTFSSLPARAASRGGLVVSGNNRMYAAHYPYRLSAAFEPPYRAYRIASLLHARERYSWQYFARMQMDTYSPLDAEIARNVSRLSSNGMLQRWNGYFTPRSTSATIAHRVREYFDREEVPLAATLADLRASRPGMPYGIARDLSYATWTPPNVHPWSEAGRVQVDHPLSSMWYGLLRGAVFPGDGDEYTIHLQEPGFAQGFRAVWEIGKWNAGGIVIPSGESGEPGSRHYNDLTASWIAGRMVPLPFGSAAVARESAGTLVLRGP
jgi:penicillin amidase